MESLKHRKFKNENAVNKKSVKILKHSNQWLMHILTISNAICRGSSKEHEE